MKFPGHTPLTCRKEQLPQIISVVVALTFGGNWGGSATTAAASGQRISDEDNFTTFVEGIADYTELYNGFLVDNSVNNETVNIFDICIVSERYAAKQTVFDPLEYDIGA